MTPRRRRTFPNVIERQIGTPGHAGWWITRGKA